MRILLVAATESEIAPLLTDRRVAGFFTPLITGAGIPATIYSLMNRLRLGKPALIINAGLAGSFRIQYSPGVVLRVESDCFADLGAEDGDSFIPIHELGFHRAHPVYEKVFAPPAITGLSPALSKLPGVQGITVNTVHGNEASIRCLEKRLQPGIESMEGAAVFFVAMKENIPVVQIRSVSNRVERRNHAAWETEKAIANLNEALAEIISEQARR